MDVPNAADNATTKTFTYRNVKLLNDAPPYSHILYLLILDWNDTPFLFARNHTHSEMEPSFTHPCSTVWNGFVTCIFLNNVMMKWFPHITNNEYVQGCDYYLEA